MPDELISGDQARALGLPVSGGPVEGVVAGSQARVLGLPVGQPMAEPDQASLDTLGHEPLKFTPREVLERNLELAGIGASSGSSQEARKVLSLANGLNLGPQIIAGKQTKDFEQTWKNEMLSFKLAQLPRLSSWMAQSPQHAAAIGQEVDHWGVLDYVFGRYSYDQKAMQDWSRDLAAGKATYQDRPKTDKAEIPGWVQAMGKAGYATSSSLQTTAMVFWGNGKSVEEIQKQRAILAKPLPGDDNWILSKINSMIGMTPIIAASAVHPALGFGLMYGETTGRVYEDLRLNGYDHQEAAPIANLIGFTSAALGAALGPMFQGSTLTKPIVGSLSTLSNSFLLANARSPTVWRGLFGLGKNFVATMAMNTSMLTSEIGIKEAFDASRQGRPYDYSRVKSAVADSLGAWAEMAALSVVPAYKQHLERKALYPIGQEASAQNERAKLAESIYQNYEKRGRKLRSMQEAADLVAAVQAVKDNEFMKTNPEDARKLIQHLTAPRASQTVFIDPKYLASLPPDSRAMLGSPDTSLGQAGNVPVNIVDFLAHPQAEEILPHIAGQIDLLQLRELTGIDLTQPEVTGANIPDDQLDAYLASERARAQHRDPNSRIPTAEEIHSAVQQARGRRPAPESESRYERQNDQRQRPVEAPEVPESKEALKAWAEDAVARRPSSELAGMVEEHVRRSEEAQREAMLAQMAATLHAEAGRPTDTAKAQAQEAQRNANISGALHKAAQKAMDEVQTIGEGIARLASEDRDQGGMTPRERAWHAGPEYGEALDALLEMTGAARVRGYAASDLSDVYDKLKREQKVSKDKFDGWDLKTTNRLLQSQQEIGNLNLFELREVNKALGQIAQAADAENSVLLNGVRVAKAMWQVEIADNLKNLPDVPKSQQVTGDSRKALAKVEGIFKKIDTKTAPLKAVLNQPHTLFFKLGKAGESLWFDQFISGVSREQRMWGDVSSQLEKILKSLPEDIRKSGDEVVHGLGKGTDGEPVLKLRSDIWHLVMHLGTEGTDIKIANGLGVTPDALWEWVHGNLGRTPEEAHVIMEKVVSPHWKLFDGLWGEYERHFRDRGIAPPEKLKGRTMTIWGKEYQGGYGGRLQWIDLKQNKPVMYSGSLESLLEHDMHGPATDNRSLIERTGVGGVPVLGMEGVEASMRKEIHDITMRPFIEDAHKIFSDGEIRGLLAQKMGKDALNQIFNPQGNKSDFLYTVARGSVADIHTAQPFTQFVSKLQGRAAYSAFNLNMRVMFGQLSHAFAAMPGLGIAPDHMAQGVHAAFNPERRGWAHFNSEVLRLRANDYEARAVELNRQLTGVEQGGRWDQRASDHVNWMAWREMDMFLSHAIWEAAYAKARGGNRPDWWSKDAGHDQAVRFADKAVTKMMPAQDIYDQAAFVRDRSVAGFFYLVKNFPVTLANVSAMNWWEARISNNPTGNKLKSTAQYVGMVMAAGVLGEGIMMRGGIPEGKDPSEWWAEHAIGALLYPFMLREPGLMAYHAMRGDVHGVRLEAERMQPPAFSVIGQGFSDIGKFMQEGDTEAAYRAAAHLVGLMAKSALPGKIYDFYNAGRNSEDPLDAVKKTAGYRQ